MDKKSLIPLKGILDERNIMRQADIIIVNYNGSEFIFPCLLCIWQQTFGDDAKLILVDNNSTDGSMGLLKEYIKEGPYSGRTVLVSLSVNAGFAAANTEGLKHSNAPYIASLNPDTEVDRKWLEELVSHMDANPDVGICASKLVVYGTDSMIDSAGDVYTTLLKGDKRGEGQPSKGFDKAEYVFGACAGAALYRRAMLDDIGFFDRDFFLIHEDTDLNLRAQLAGWKVMYVPTAIVHHKVRSSIGKMSELAAYYSLRNSELVRFKSVPLGVFLSCLPQFLIGMISEFLYFAIKHRLFRLYFKAKCDALKLLPKMLRKRKEILRKRKVSNKYIIEIMTPLMEKNFIKSKIRKLFYD